VNTAAQVPNRRQIYMERLSWFRWIPRFVFVISGTPLILALPGLVAYDLNRLANFAGLILIAVAVAWFEPLLGGFILIFGVPLGFYWVTNTSPPKIANPGWQPYSLVYLYDSYLLAIGGILSIIWGLIRRKRKQGQGQDTK
jgi:hypothetical protein